MKPPTTSILQGPLTLDAIILAILSVYNKQGLLDLAKGLIKHDVRLLASGGTAKRKSLSGGDYFPHQPLSWFTRGWKYWLSVYLLAILYRSCPTMEPHC